MRKLLIPVSCILILMVVMLTAMTDGMTYLHTKLHNWILKGNKNDSKTKI